MKKVKIGFLGLGYMGQLAHLLHYVQLPDFCEIVALCDVRIKMAQKLAERYDIPKTYADHREFLADNEIEAVVCIQQFENHVILVPEVLRAGKHLMTEKPLCVFPQNGEKLAQVAKETGMLHMVGYHKRSDPATEHAYKIINEWKQSGEMGKMTYIRLSMPPGDYRKDPDTPYFTDEPPMPVPPEPAPVEMSDERRNRVIWFVNYYIHQVNLIRHLLGEDYQLTYADKHLFTGISENGVNCMLELEPFTTSVDWQEHALVCFERGWVRIDLTAPLAAQLASTVTVFKDTGLIGSTFTAPVMTNVCAMRNQAKNFLLTVAGERSAPCVSEEAVKDLRIAEDYIRMTEQLNDVRKPYHLRNVKE